MENNFKKILEKGDSSYPPPKKKREKINSVPETLPFQPQKAYL